MSIVKVDQEKCIGCGACVAIDPENFDFNDEGISTVINEVAAPAAKDAEEACPVLAIDVVEEEVKETNTSTPEEQDEETCCDECDGNCECDCECDDDCECGEECECHHNHEESEKEDEEKED